MKKEYDTTLLPADVGFSLLKKLYELEEPVAKYVFKKEILKGFLSGKSPVIDHLLKYRYLQFFNQEELAQLFDERNLEILSGGSISPDNFKRVKEYDEHFILKLKKKKLILLSLK